MRTPYLDNLRLRPILDQQRSAWRILNFFGRTARTEPAFRTRFTELPAEDRAFLRGFYTVPGDSDVFRRLCTFWDVRPMEPEMEKSRCKSRP